MELIKLRDPLINKKFTDIKLIFSNNTCQVTVGANKIILVSNCKYFEKMFNFNGDITTTTIIVDEPEIALDIMLSFYGIKSNSKNYPEWRHILEVFKTRQFFYLDNDVSKLYNLSVPSEGFDLFLEVASQFDIAIDHKLLKNIKRNLPEKYDLAKLSESFIELLQKKNRFILSRDYGNINVWDAENYSLIYTLTGHNDCIHGLIVSSDGSKIVSGNHDKTIKIWDVEDGSLIHTLKGHTGPVRCVAISSDCSQIVSGSDDTTIKIWDAFNESSVQTLTGHEYSVTSVANSLDGLKLFLVSLTLV